MSDNPEYMAMYRKCQGWSDDVLRHMKIRLEMKLADVDANPCLYMQWQKEHWRTELQAAEAVISARKLK